MKISIAINSILAGCISLLWVIPATANVKFATIASFDDDLAPDAAETQLNDATKTDPATVTIKRLAPVFYLKDKSPDSDLELNNLTMGIAKKGERVTIIKQREGMLKVQFEATGEIGWVSQRVFQDL